MLKPDLARFLSQNMDLIENNDFDSLYNSIWKGIRPRELTSVFLQADIDFLSYMRTIPPMCFGKVDIEEIVIPGNIEVIKTYAFLSCNVRKIYIEEGVKEIDDSAFNSCLNLVDISIPKSIAYIGYGPLAGSPKLTEINFRGTKEEFSEIEKSESWNPRPKIKTVICTDGKITY